MSTVDSTRIQVHCTDTLTEKIEAVHNRITQRAYERWLNRRAPGQTPVEFWAAAERELFCRPNTEVRDWAHGVLIQIPCVNVEPSSIRLFMSPRELLVLAPLNSSGLDRWLFGYLRFEKPLDNVEASAQFSNGNLCISAACVNAPEEEKLRFRVA